MLVIRQRWGTWSVPVSEGGEGGDSLVSMVPPAEVHGEMPENVVVTFALRV